MKKRYTYLQKNWLRLGLLTAFVGSLSLDASAQNGPSKQWDKTLGGNDYEYFGSIQQTKDNGFIIGGASASNISGDKSQASRGFEDYWVIKIDSVGNKIWDRTFGGNAVDWMASLQQTSDNGYILGGSSNSSIGADKSQGHNGSSDYWVIKLDSAGNKLWDKTIGGNNHDILTSLQQTSDGGFILGGYSESGIGVDKSQASKGGKDYWVVKLDANGNKLWDKSFGGGSNDFLQALQQTSDGGYIIGGESFSTMSIDKSENPKGFFDYWLLKLDANGNKQWDKTLGGDNNERLYSLQLTSDGGYIIGGESFSSLSGNKSENSKGASDFWIVKLNASGIKQWDKTIGGNNSEFYGYLQKAKNGGYIIAGGSSSGISGDKSQSCQGGSDYWLVKLNSSGNKLWDKTIGGNKPDGCFGLMQVSDGSLILGGSSDSDISSDKSQQCQGFQDYWIVKLAADITGIKETEANFTVSISPNPNHGNFTLQLSNLTAPKVAVTISDLIGRVVLQQELNVSNNQLSEELILPNAKGMYLMQVKACEQLLTRKIVVE